MTHLHSHSSFSLQDGYGIARQIADRVQEMGHNSLCISDHGNLFSVVPFNKELKKRNIKYIPGCEMYCVEDHTLRTNEQRLIGIDARPHVTVIARNQRGYQNLL